MEPMKGLLKKKNAFVWNKEHTASMDKVKSIITGPQCLTHFDPKLYTTLITDASRRGLGYILIQSDKPPGPSIPKGWLITCGSRFLSEAGGNCAVVELELLAIPVGGPKMQTLLSWNRLWSHYQSSAIDWNHEWPQPRRGSEHENSQVNVKTFRIPIQGQMDTGQDTVYYRRP